MKIEIWSDVMCPFCYIGKRRFEKALAEFPENVKVEVEWKSFQLSPNIKTDPSINIHQFLAKHKGMSLDEAKQMNDQVTQMAAKEGLVYNFDKSVVANSYNAHRFVHFAKTNDKQDEAEEKLFEAYFTNGKNIDDYETLIELGLAIGLDQTKLREVLNNGEYGDEVNGDIAEAQALGIRGVPFFVFDRKFAVSGAQEKSAFRQALDKAFEESAKNQINHK
jgi:predicted DsbA family dithiol-disulfide isomerase